MYQELNKTRDLRLDFFRGFALITIFINHVPGTIYENFTSRNFGFSDAAEAFVLMAGIAAAFAYTNPVKRSFKEAFMKTSARSFKLYWVHILITILAVSGVIALANALDTQDFLYKNNMKTLFESPTAGITGVLTLGHQLGYFNILPLYAVLIFSSPFLVSAAVKSPYSLLSVSGGLWMATHLMGINFPNYPTSGGWFLNPLAWQFVFIIGIVIGVSVKEKKTFCSFNPFLYALAVGYLVFSFAIVYGELWSYISYPSLPSAIFGFNKSFLAFPRLLHVLALAYVVIHLPIFTTIANSQIVKPIRYLGQHSLVAFATGSVLCVLFQVIKTKYQLTVTQDFVLLTSGVGLQFLMIKLAILYKTFGMSETEKSKIA